VTANSYVSEILCFHEMYFELDFFLIKFNLGFAKDIRRKLLNTRRNLFKDEKEVLLNTPRKLLNIRRKLLNTRHKFFTTKIA